MAANTGTAAIKARSSKKKEKDPNGIKILNYGGSVDVPMLIITLVLLIIGITMMFSASHAQSYAESEDNDSYMYVRKQVLCAGIGLAAMFFVSFIDYRILKKDFYLLKIRWLRTNLAKLFLIFSMVIVASVIPFGYSNTPGGPVRWLKMPFVGGFQPSELLKLALIVYFAYYIAKNYSKMRYFYTGLFVPMLIMGIVAVLIMKQPHLSCLLIMVMIVGCMLFIGGINVKPVIFVGIAAAAVLILLISISGFTYFWDRIKNTFDPLADTLGKTYQSYQSILAVGSGGFWGVGFGNSAQKYGYLPEAQNDFVYAILCEEFGFIGGALVILLFLIFVFRGFYIARKSEDRFGMLLATGISLQVGLQALLNVGVNVCAIPNTGISMPFFSYGGTALVIQLTEMGLLLSVSRRAKLN